ncbi:response regulator [Roseateles chitinivorans]|uniref:response regulator n=1 Tax=Roseateles chitinivorans TaxID=2917965 RepID=UPI003D678BEF
MKLILIVEDEYGAAEILQLILEAHGYRVTSVSNGRAAMEMLGGERPAVIVSDFMMPHMTGGEFGTLIRQTPHWADIPFMFISGTNEEVVQKSFGDYDGFLSKPFDIDVMLAMVADLAAGGVSNGCAAATLTNPCGTFSKASKCRAVNERRRHRAPPWPLKRRFA